MTRKQPEAGAGATRAALRRGAWTPEEDELLARAVAREGEGQWRTLPRRAGLLRCGKSCRLRWMNYLRPDIKRGPIAADEEDLIVRLHRLLGNRCVRASTLCAAVLISVAIRRAPAAMLNHSLHRCDRARSPPAGGR